MLKRFIILFFLIAWPLLAFGQELPQAPDDPLQNTTVAFDGQWLPDRDPAEIGANNFKTLQNMRYRPGGIEGILGYSKINTTALSPATYPYGRSGFHFKKDHPSESHVLYHADNSPETASVVWENSTAIPSQGDFSATVMHTDATSAGLGRFSTAPDGMAYCNGKECLSWSGDEMPLSGFFTITQIENASTYTLTFAAAADTIVDDDGGNFVTAGYRPGQIIDITGASGDNTRSFTIKKISNSVATNDMITVVEDAVTDNAGDTGCTLTARIETLGYENAIDFVEGVNNTLTTADNLAYLEKGKTAPGSKVANPGTLPTGIGEGAAFNHDGSLLAVAHTTSPYVTIYNTSDWSKVANPGTLPTGDGYGTAFNHDGTLLAIAHVTSPYVTIYNTSDWSKVANPGTLPTGDSAGAAFNHDGSLLAVAHTTSPYVTIYNTSDWSKVANPGTLPTGIGRGAAFNHDGTLLAIAHYASPYVTIYNTSDWSKVANPGTLPTGYGRGAAFNHDGTLLAIAHVTSPYVTIYNTSDWSKVANPGTLPTGYGRGAAFNHDGSLLAVAHTTSPYVTIYNTSDWSKVANPGTLPTGDGYGTAFNHDGSLLAVAHNASPYVTIYSVLDGCDWLVLTTRPLQGIKYYVQSVNTVASTTTAWVWDGSSFSSRTITDGTKPGTISLAQTGSMSFSSTENDAKPLHFEGAYLYAYLFSLSAGGANVYHVTADAPFQPIVNVWDEVHRLPIMFQFYDQSVPAYDDFTVAVSQYSGATGAFGADIDDMTSSDHIIVMFEERVAAIYFTMSSSAEVNVNASIPDIEYHDGTDWVSVGTIVDGTTGDDNDWETLGQSGLASWNPPGEHEEVKQTIFGITGYAYRIKVSATLSATVTIDTVFGIPAQSTVKPFKFPGQFKDRTLLCGFTEGNEGNRIDFSMPGSSDVWNGELSSMDGIYSIRVPGQGDLTCGTELYNRYGSNVFAFWLAFKNTETHVIAGDHPTGDNAFKVFPVSDTIGCPAPLTLATAEIGYEMAEGVGRQMAFWVSTAGPMKFDGGVMSPLVDADGNGVQTFFDPASSDCITFANIADARGWYDSTYAEYNIVFPGDSLWLVYDLIEKKWYRKVPATYPKCGFPVYDTNGVQYIYAGLDTGYMMRLENGNTWDGTGIAQTVETGDFFPSKDSWHKTRLRQFKVAAKATPVEDTGDYTLGGANYEDGTPDRVVVTDATTITVTDLDNDEEVWVVKDMGADYFSHDFEFYVDLKCTGATAGGERVACWALANTVDTLGDIDTANGDYLAVYWDSQFIGESIEIKECNGGATDSHSWEVFKDTDYYLKIVRDESVGTYGTLYCYLYTDATYTTLVGTMIRALTEKQDFRYLYWLNTVELGTSAHAWSGEISNLTISANLAMTHYADTATSGTSLTALNLSSGSNRIVRDTQACNLLGWSHRLKFEVTTSNTAKRFQPLAWGYQWKYVRDDL